MPPTDINGPFGLCVVEASDAAHLAIVVGRLLQIDYNNQGANHDNPVKFDVGMDDQFPLLEPAGIAEGFPWGYMTEWRVG